MGKIMEYIDSMGLLKRTVYDSSELANLTKVKYNSSDTVPDYLLNKMNPVGSLRLSGGQLSLVGDVNNPGAGYRYGTNGAGIKGWYPQTYSIDVNQVQLGGQVNTPFGEANEAILDHSGSSTAFELVLNRTGKWHVHVYAEGIIRPHLPTGVTSISLRLIWKIYTRAGTTDTYQNNMTVCYSVYSDLSGTLSPYTFFNSSFLVVPVNVTYTGQTTDIRNSTVNGTVVLIKHYYTSNSPSGNGSSGIAASFSTSKLWAAYVG
jgi:hypothetical protein